MGLLDVVRVMSCDVVDASPTANPVISADLSHTTVFGVGAPLAAAATDPPESPWRPGVVPTDESAIGPSRQANSRSAARARKLRFVPAVSAS